MIFKKFLLFILLLSFQFTFSQDFDYSILAIPDSLKQNANSVVLFDDTKIELESSRKMVESYKKAVTVLNKLGDQNSQIVIHYDSSNDIKNVRAYIYNALGTEIKDIKKRDFIDRSAADGISLFNDGRLIYYDYVPTSYPYTIYYEYEIESSNTAFIPKWYPYDSYNQSVVKSSYQIIYPNDITIQKSEKNFDNFKIRKSENPNTLSYEINNSPAIKYEELAPSRLKIMPWLIVASNKFRLENVDGSANNWQEFGKWMYDNLIIGRTALPESTKNKIKQMVAGIEDPVEKAKIIYNYVQRKTRYISVQVGIGGWMPMLAEDVDKLSYGDCKALTNYTKSLLDEVGVISYYAPVYAGNTKRSMEKDVVSVQGNHAFLYVQGKDKDIWLECTSQTVPFGYQGTFTDDREVLLITPEGGKLKHTGVYKNEDSFQNTVANYRISNNGDIDAEVEINSGGIQYSNHFNIENDSKRDIEEYYKSDYWPYINNMTVNNYNFKNNRDSIIFTENIEIIASKYASFSGNRMLFEVNAFNRALEVPKRYRNRKLPFEISRGFIDKDEFKISLPANYKIEALPNTINIENKFGSYQFSIEKIDENKLKYTRIFMLNEGMYPAKNYKAYRDFRKTIAKQDKSKIVLIKSTP
ncbi:DUF3857 domain-containing protein [Aureibaculum sp. 2210JD6-5]|uniref:DUF3857 domain-containing protein n=1 Tax=Aureibaculum sp. 2210JD6-5 TaxID=3103957 RepID=UPI002AAD9F4A|nr:DUF3857 domain-containing protein [Aureibaculum sp. 2210JD6-5]MDY7395748.1 DUF3857 domain-containing protein [Aureibaculum sp. 2210JD6-5]